MIFGQQVYTMNGPCEADGTIQPQLRSNTKRYLGLR